MQDCRLSDDYASLILNTAMNIQLHYKKVTEKKQIRPPQKKTNGSEDDQIIQNLETNRRKILATLSNNFPVSRFSIQRFGCNCPPWL